MGLPRNGKTLHLSFFIAVEKLQRKKLLFNVNHCQILAKHYHFVKILFPKKPFNYFCRAAIGVIV